MSPRSIQYFIFLLFPVLLGVIISLIMLEFCRLSLSHFWSFFLSFAALMHIAAGIFLFPSSEDNDPEKAKKRLMASLVVTVLRLLFSMVLFLLYVLLSDENHMLGAIYFVSLYFFFLLFDVLSKSIFFSTNRKK